MASTSDAALRWGLLRHYLLSNRGCTMKQGLTTISRRPNGHFGLVTCHVLGPCETFMHGERPQHEAKGTGNVLIEYLLPAGSDMKLVLLQREENGVGLADLEISRKNLVDMTGIVGLWPSEEVLTYFSVSNPSIFRSRRIVELGSGIGLAGLAIAACTDAAEVVLTDGNPQVVQYIEHNIERNIEAFGKTKVNASILRWCTEMPSTLSHSFDTVIAADCTFFNASHDALVSTVRGLLKRSRDCQALFFNPQRGGSLTSFLQVAKESSLTVELLEHYDDHMWSLHQSLLKGHTSSWTNYDPEHCYPVLAVLRHADL